MFRINSSGPLVEAVPALIGYVPVKSVILVLLDEHQLPVAVMGVSVAAAGELLGHLAQAAGRQGAVSGAVVVVDSDVTTAHTSDWSPTSMPRSPVRACGFSTR